MTGIGERLGRRRPAAAGTALVLIALVLPGVVSQTDYGSYAEHVAVQMMLMGLYAMSWDFLNGEVGLFSFGHAAFFGTGAYAAAILVSHGYLGSTFLAVLVALPVVVLAGLVVGLLSSRVGSVAVFLVTFACAETMYMLVLADPSGLTNGENGLPGVVPTSAFGIDFRGSVSFYYLTLLVTVASYLVVARITRSQFGRVLRAIRDNEVRARFAGYRVEQYKTAAFAISAFFAGLAGLLTAFHERVASPEAYGWAMSGDAVLYAILGGTGTLLGPILGAGVIILAREILSEVFRSWLMLVGATYVALVFFLPGGLYPLLRRRRPAEPS